MTPKEIAAIETWIKEPRTPVHICACIGYPEAPLDTTETVYECVHGKRLTWSDARKAMGLPL